MASPWNAGDYDAYWRAVAAAAGGIGIKGAGTAGGRCERRAPAHTMSSACPSGLVFIYELRAPLSDFDVRNATLKSVFGAEVASRHIRATYQYALGEILLHRLWNSPCRTLDPSKASIFFAPILPKQKNLKGTKGAAGLREACARIKDVDWAAALPHLSTCTASRHVVVLAHEHFPPNSEDAYCPGWFSSPRGELRHALRIAHTSLLPLPLRAHSYLLPGEEAHAFATDHARAIYPNLLSVPLPSVVHWEARGAAGGAVRSRGGRHSPRTERLPTLQPTPTPPWVNGAPRARLMLFLASATFLGGNANASRDCSSMANLNFGFSKKTCRQFDSPGAAGRCEAHRVGQTPCVHVRGEGCRRDLSGVPCRPMRHAEVSHGDRAVREAIREQCARQPGSACLAAAFTSTTLIEKRRSVFCLEPAGDAPIRKSIADSVGLGCIPVFFNNLTAHLYGTWVDGNPHLASVLVPREPFVRGRIDLRRLLEATPPPLLAAIKCAVAAEARHMQLSLDDDPLDMVAWLLRKALAHAEGSSPASCRLATEVVPKPGARRLA